MKRRVWLSAIILVLVSVVLVFASSHNAEEAYTKLMEGNKRFVSGNLLQKDLGDVKRKELAKRQHPFAIVVTCSDSRVSPEIIFDQGLEIYLLSG